jgi:hypothetical protein
MSANEEQRNAPEEQLKATFLDKSFNLKLEVTARMLSYYQ